MTSGPHNDLGARLKAEEEKLLGAMWNPCSELEWQRKMQTGENVPQNLQKWEEMAAWKNFG